ncbi:hypothetical protein REPUB_Repub17cG0099400 [Reevesia pubescens]
MIPINGETYFHEPSGRFCDGRLIIDFLMEAMELPYPNPYLDSVWSPSFETGCNFATGVSTILPANAASTSPFSFNLQLSQFFRFKNRVLAILSQDNKELQKYLPAEDYFKQGLYMFDIGQNDLDASLYSSTSEEQVLALISKLLSALKYGMKFLAQLPEANCTYVDIYSIKLNLISNYSLYGFQQPLASCCGYGGPPLNFDIRIACGLTKNLNGSIVTVNPCNNTSAEYINWDGNHYTEAANRFVANLILTGNYTDSPHLANTPLILPQAKDVENELIVVFSFFT